MDKKVSIAIVFLIIGFSIGCLVGYAKGVKDTSTWFAEKVVFFTEMKGGEIIIDVEMLANGIINYQHNINRCFENALIYDNKGDQE